MKAFSYLSLLALIVSVPLVFDSRVNVPFYLPKILLFQLLLIISSICYIFSRRLYALPRLKILDCLIISYLLVNIIATIFAKDALVSFFGAYHRYEGLITTILYILLFYLCSEHINSLRRIEVTLKLVVFVSVLVSFYGISQLFYETSQWQAFVSEGKIFATFGNPNFLAVYLLMATFLGLTFFLSHQKNDYKKILWGAATLIIYSGLFLTKSRGAYGAFIIGALLYICLLGYRRIKAMAKPLSVFVSILICLTLFLNFTTKSPIERLSETIERGITFGGQVVEPSGLLGGRKCAWESAIAIIKDYPIIGVGLDNMRKVYAKYKSAEAEQLEGHNAIFDRAHNNFLDICVTRGILGLFIYLCIFLGLIYWGLVHLVKLQFHVRLLSIAILCGLCSYLLQNIFNFDVLSYTLLAWIKLAILTNIVRLNRKAQRVKRLPYKIGVGVLLVLLFYSVGVYIKHYIGDIYMKQAEDAFKQSKYIAAAHLYQKAIKYNLHEPIYYEGLIKTNFILAQQTGSPYWRGCAREAIYKALELEPDNAFYYNALAATYALAYDSGEKKAMAKAIKLYKKAIQLDPYFAEPYANMALLYKKTGNFTTALYYQKKAYQITKSTQYLSGLIGIHYEIVKKYFNASKYNEAAQELLKIRELAPHDLTVRNDLAAAYYKANKIDLAKREVLWVLQRTPQDERARSLWALLHK